MIVYGDPSFCVPGTELLAGLRARVSKAGCVPDLDGLRSLLIHAGQAEQAFADVPDLESGHLATATEITDACAEAFVAWHSVTPSASIRTALQRAEAALRTLAPPPRPARVKVPEGFAFYSLFPEQYAAAAFQWDAAHPHGERAPVLVVGVRSIGTSLSAVVAAVLRQRGWDTRRATLRPTGHPFSREAALPPELCRGAAYGLVVDEGPGLSGSSMAAVARALVGAGMPRERITFLPGHPGDPGGSASPDVREWWSGTARLAIPTADLRWEDRSLTAVLARETERLLPDGGGVERVEDFSGGRWRQAAYPSAAVWPAVCAPFERPKCRCVLRDGRSVLWKFAGLAIGPDGRGMAEAALQIQADRAAAGWSAAPLAQALGFVAVPWLDGERLTPADAEPGLVERLSCYVAQAAGAPLSPRQSVEAAERLREMLYWNTWELLGEAAAEPLKRLPPTVMSPDTPAYGDGRLAPHEWLRMSDRRIIKAGMSGGATDHTAVGVQPVWWDVAGVLTEWRLDAEQRRHFLHALVRHLNCGTSPELIDYFQAAYAAFRAGQCVMCAGMTGDASERQRLERAAVGYRDALAHTLSALAPGR